MFSGFFWYLSTFYLYDFMFFFQRYDVGKYFLFIVCLVEKYYGFKGEYRIAKLNHLYLNYFVFVGFSWLILQLVNISN